MDFINRLKKVCEQIEWENYREEILKNEGTIKYLLLEAEGMYERLLNDILASGSLFSLDLYEKLLKRMFPEQVRDAYVRYVIQQADGVVSRKHYKDLMKYLKKIRSYPGGKETAAKVAENWRVSYYRRPAMMDELRKAGF